MELLKIFKLYYIKRRKECRTGVLKSNVSNGIVIISRDDVWLWPQRSSRLAPGTGNWETGGRFMSRKYRTWQSWEVNVKSSARAHRPHSWGTVLCSNTHRPQHAYMDSAERLPVTVSMSWHFVTRWKSDLWRMWAALALTIILKTIKIWGDFSVI